MAEQLFQIRESTKMRLEQVIRWTENLRVTGPGVTFRNTRDGAQICLTRPRAPQVIETGVQLIPVKVTAATRDGANWRWVYTVRRQIKNATGYAGWVEADGEDLTAYNSVEADNGSSGTVSGITLDTTVTGLLPCPTGMLVWCSRQVVEGGEPELWFSWQNVPTIECE